MLNQTVSALLHFSVAPLRLSQVVDMYLAQAVHGVKGSKASAADDEY